MHRPPPRWKRQSSTPAVVATLPAIAMHQNSTGQRFGANRPGSRVPPHSAISSGSASAGASTPIRVTKAAVYFAVQSK